MLFMTLVQSIFQFSKPVKSEVSSVSLVT